MTFTALFASLLLSCVVPTGDCVEENGNGGYTNVCNLAGDGGGTPDGGGVDGGGIGDGGSPDGGTPDGGGTDGGGAKDGGGSDGGSPDGGSPDGGAKDGGSPDGGSPDGGGTDGGGGSDGGDTGTDAGSSDGGDTGTDGGSPDGGSTDGGGSDGGDTGSDGGGTDGGAKDGGGTSDGGTPDGGGTDAGSTDGGGSSDGGGDTGIGDGGAEDGGSSDGGTPDGGGTDGGASDGGDTGTDGGSGDGGTEPVDNDGDGYTNDVDCNDDNVSVHPDADEVCNSIDDNCVGGIDEGVVPTWYADGDLDGYGNPDDSMLLCEAPDGYVDNAADCDDARDIVNPGEPQDCYSGLDEDCDGDVAFADSDCNVASTANFFTTGGSWNGEETIGVGSIGGWTVITGADPEWDCTGGYTDECSIALTAPGSWRVITDTAAGAGNTYCMFSAISSGTSSSALYSFGESGPQMYDAPGSGWGHAVVGPFSTTLEGEITFTVTLGVADMGETLWVDAVGCQQ